MYEYYDYEYEQLIGESHSPWRVTQRDQVSVTLQPDWCPFYLMGTGVVKLTGLPVNSDRRKFGSCYLDHKFQPYIYCIYYIQPCIYQPSIDDE